MQGLVDHGQNLKGYTVLYMKPVELLKDRGNVVVFLGMSGQSSGTIETGLKSVKYGFGEAKEYTITVIQLRGDKGV